MGSFINHKLTTKQAAVVVIVTTIVLILLAIVIEAGIAMFIATLGLVF